jgi:hypothetical protein
MRRANVRWRVRELPLNVVEPIHNTITKVSTRMMGYYVSIPSNVARFVPSVWSKRITMQLTEPNNVLTLIRRSVR